MNRIIYKCLEINKIVLDESFVTGMRWRNENGKDLEIYIDWCGQDDLKNKIDFMKVKTKVKFELAYNVAIDFKFSGTWTLGSPEITSFKITKDGDAYVADIRFDFAPVGYIHVECRSVEFIIEEI
jgi:hypothetical protein